jgi:low affinity Fe/Cu permease
MDLSAMTRLFTRFANNVAHAAGRPMTFALCCLAIILWGATGPLFGFSDTWQLIINTSTTIITFLMVFLIQNTQNRDGAAIQTKLDELIRSSSAKNVFIGIEHLPEEQVEKFRQRCEEAAKKSGEKLLRKATRKAADAAARATGSEH